MSPQPPACPFPLPQVRKAEPSGSGWELQPQPLLHLGSGRVLAGQFDSAGALWLCDAVKGLLRVDLGADGGRPSVELVASKVGHGRWLGWLGWPGLAEAVCPACMYCLAWQGWCGWLAWHG